MTSDNCVFFSCFQNWLNTCWLIPENENCESFLAPPPLFVPSYVILWIFNLFIVGFYLNTVSNFVISRQRIQESVKRQEDWSSLKGYTFIINIYTDLWHFKVEHFCKIHRLTYDQQVKGPTPTEVSYHDSVYRRGHEKRQPWCLHILKRDQLKIKKYY